MTFKEENERIIMIKGNGWTSLDSDSNKPQ